MEWSLPDVLDVVTDVVPDRTAMVFRDERRTYASVRERSRNLAAWFVSEGLGVRRERAELERWECGQSRIALVMSNCPEYIETMIGAYRARAVPFNVNQHYHPREIAALLDQMSAEAIVYHRRFGPLLAEESAQEGRVLVDLDDGSGVDPLPGSTSFDDVVAADRGSAALPQASPDDVNIVCTGGTTGRPKGVMWRQADAFVATLGGPEDATAEAIRARTGNDRNVMFATSPLMHSAGQRSVLSTMLTGGTAVMRDDASHFDAQTLLQTAERERVTTMAIVGDAYARPIIDELRVRHYDLSALQRLGSGGATTSASTIDELLELLPHVMVGNSYSSSESGMIAGITSTKGQHVREFTVSRDAGVLSEDRTHFLQPGDTEVGWTAKKGRVPLGYIDDQAATERTFPVIEGARVSVPGDRATMNPDGKIVLLGRDSMVINSGGEKVFVEEVEEALRGHAEILDALVVGRPNDRLGQEVVALVQLRPGVQLTPHDIREYAAGSVARFKAPRAVRLCDRIQRLASGKPDYAWAREMAVDAVSAT